MQRSGWVCSNDLFRDHLGDRARRFGPAEAATLAAYIDEHVIPYTWRAATEFLPQPVKARAALLAPRPVTPDVVNAAAQLPAGAAEALAAARRPPGREPYESVAAASLVSRVPRPPPPAAPQPCSWDDDDTDMLPVDAPPRTAHATAASPAASSRVDDLPAHLRRIVVAALGSTGDGAPAGVASSPRPTPAPASPSVLNAVVAACAEAFDRAWAVLEAGQAVEARAASAEALAAAVLRSFAADVAAAARLAGLTHVPPQPTPLWGAAREALLIAAVRLPSTTARQP